MQKCSRQHPRAVALFVKRDPNVPKSITEKMIGKFDTDRGRTYIIDEWELLNQYSVI